MTIPKGGVKYPNPISDARAIGRKLGYNCAIRDVIAVVDDYISAVRGFKDERHNGAFASLTMLREHIAKVGEMREQ
jgi:hypothetical protein